MAPKAASKAVPAKVPTHPPWVEMIKVRRMADSPSSSHRDSTTHSLASFAPHLGDMDATSKAGQVGWIVVDRAHWAITRLHPLDNSPSARFTPFAAYIQ